MGRVRAWNDYLFRRMGPKEEFLQSAQNLSIVTFNYDRSLEFYLYRMTGESFGEDFAVEVLKEIAFIDVYGHLDFRIRNEAR